VTAILLIRLVPRALALPSPEQLRKSNAALQGEIEERIKAAGKIESLNQELRVQAAKIETTNKELEAFSYSVSHDLRAPLRHINGYIDLLGGRTSALDQEGEHYMKKIAGSAKQMGMLIDDLLAFSGMGRAAMELVWADTNALVARLA
jgi:light-regulated signal transduction histidine kinase (bacteriophytochrome)